MEVGLEEILCGLDVLTRIFTRAHEAEVMRPEPLTFSAHWAGGVGEWGAKDCVAED